MDRVRLAAHLRHLLGHAVPMPITLRTRFYDDAFFDAMRAGRPSGSAREMEAALGGLF